MSNHPDPSSDPLSALGPEWAAVFRSAIESAYDAVLITDAELDEPGPHILYINPAFTEMTGWTQEAIVGRTPRILQGEKTDPRVLRRLRQALDHGTAFDARTVNYRRDGSAFDLEWRTAPIRDDTGRITHYISIQRDVTSEQRLIERLRRQAEFDDLTGVHTRRPAEAAIKAEIERAQRHDVPLNVIMLDIDHFKPINDEHGHAAGDDVLRQLVRLIARRLRANDLLARWGGEEFLIALPHTTADGARQVADALRGLIESATFVDRIEVTASLGVAAFAPGDNVATLVERADAALYDAKTAGRNRVECR